MTREQEIARKKQIVSAAMALLASLADGISDVCFGSAADLMTGCARYPWKATDKERFRH